MLRDMNNTAISHRNISLTSVNGTDFVLCLGRGHLTNKPVNVPFTASGITAAQNYIRTQFGYSEDVLEFLRAQAK